MLIGECAGSNFVVCQFSDQYFLVNRYMESGSIVSESSEILILLPGPEDRDSKRITIFQKEFKKKDQQKSVILVSFSESKNESS